MQRSTVAFHRRQIVYLMLESFGLDAAKFLSALHTTRSIISGSSALVCLFPGQFKPMDLNVYTPLTQRTHLIDLICAISQFRVAEIVLEDILDDISATIFLRSKKHQRCITVSVSKTENALRPVFYFDSTHLMNFVSGHGIGCAYPSLTLKGRGVLNRGRGLSTLGDITLNDYWKSTGFTVCRKLSSWSSFDNHRCMIDGCCPLTVRHVDDAHTLFLGFPRTLDNIHCTGKIFSRGHIYSNKREILLWGLRTPCKYKGATIGHFTVEVKHSK